MKSNTVTLLQVHRAFDSLPNSSQYKWQKVDIIDAFKGAKVMNFQDLYQVLMGYPLEILEAIKAQIR